MNLEQVFGEELRKIREEKGLSREPLGIIRLTAKNAKYTKTGLIIYLGGRWWLQGNPAGPRPSEKGATR